MFVLSPKGPYVCINCGNANNASVIKTFNSGGPNFHARSPSTATSSLLSNALNKGAMTQRLTECSEPNCKKPVDEYVQLDNNILFLDAILQKTRFYRHILLNCVVDRRDVLKMSIMFGLCEAFQRWTTLYGAISASDHSPTSSTNLIASNKTYFQLEITFYITFLRVILEFGLFAAIFFLIFRLLISLIPRTMAAEIGGAIIVPLPDLTRSIIVCSYGKLFIIASYLYAGELKQYIDHLIIAFCFLSMVQCALVKSRNRLKRRHAVTLVASAIALHYILLNFAIIPIFCYVARFASLNENSLTDYLV